MRTTFRNAEIPGRIANLQPFLSTGTLPDGTRRWWGISSPAPDMGFLPRKYHASARVAVYTVISYGTPIAWATEADEVDCDHPNGFGPHGCPCGAVLDGEDVITWRDHTYCLPDVSYSPTTGQHQYGVRDAWSTQLRRQGTFPSLGYGRRREVVRVPGNAVVYGQERRLRAGGMDGHRPGAGLDGGAPVDEHNYTYPGTGGLQRMGPPVGDSRNRAHP
jgi:hypothetical protein